MNAIDEILRKLPDEVSKPLERCRPLMADKAIEIVLRADRPLCIYAGKRYFFITKDGSLTDSSFAENLLHTSAKDIESTVLKLCDYSIYAYQNEINGGYITIGSGVRVGLCGHAVVSGGEITNIRDISTLSFRIAREIRGCSKPLLQKLDPLHGLLLCGAPGSGKTTLVRDIARVLSYRCRVSVLDERGELSSYCRGKSGFDLGLSDIYCGYRKGDAALAAIRSMSPDIIICDEMGERSDADLLMYTMRCGVSFIATVHACSMDDLRSRKVTADMIDTGAFRYIAFLDDKDSAGKLSKIYEMRDVYR